MPNTVYVLYMEDGAYSDYSMNIVGVFSTLTLARAYDTPPKETYRGTYHWGEWRIAKDWDGALVPRVYIKELLEQQYDSPHYTIAPFVIDVVEVRDSEYA